MCNIVKVMGILATVALACFPVNPEELDHCSSDEIKCNGTSVCIEDNYRCDGDDDCGDGEDEENCSKTSCHESKPIRCNGTITKCISSHDMCDDVRDCPDGEDERNCSSFYDWYDIGLPGLVQQCSVTGWIHCNGTGKCIAPSWICDGANDCGDHEDERNCTTACSAIGRTLCNGTGKCIRPSFVCDGDNDCGDHEDEENCTTVRCPSFKPIKCNATGSRCIYSSWICNGLRECPDGEDERNCSTPCPSYLYMPIRCNSTSNRCISSHRLCDGRNDCGDNEDERNCTDKCPSYRPIRCNGTTMTGMHRAYSTARCIPTSYLCNGDNDCGDNEDERNCTCPSVRPIRCNGTLSTLFRCIPASYLCDGGNDCGDYEDERNCRNGLSQCSRGEIKCNGTSKCIRASYKCDGDNDCGDSEDERNCATCKGHGWIQCNATAGLCLAPYWMCNGFNDCPDGEDERNCTTIPDRRALALNSCSVGGLIACNSTIGHCVHPSSLCDGWNDCGDHEDERNCSSAIISITEESTTTLKASSINEDSTTSPTIPSITEFSANSVNMTTYKDQVKEGFSPISKIVLLCVFTFASLLVNVILIYKCCKRRARKSAGEVSIKYTRSEDKQHILLH